MTARRPYLLRVFHGQHGTLLAEVVAADGGLAVITYARRGGRRTAPVGTTPINDPDQTIELPPVHGRRFDPVPVSMLIERIAQGSSKLRMFPEGSFEHVVGRRRDASPRRQLVHALVTERAALEWAQARGNTGMARFHQHRIDEARAELDRLGRDTP